MRNSSSPRKIRDFSPWLDSLSLLLWGALLLKYAVMGELALLIHPNYFGLSIAAGLVLVGLGAGKIWQTVNPSLNPSESVEHIVLLPHNIGSGLLIFVAIAGFIFPPTLLGSQTAIQRGLTQELPLTRSQPASFRTGSKPEDRTLLDWIRTLNAYPEPDAYTGDPAVIKGFVTHLPQLPDNYMMVSRFVLTCCAVDAYPVGLPVKLEGDRQKFEQDSWVEVEGTMITEDLAISDDKTAAGVDQRQLVIQSSKVTPIDTPKNPYEY